MFDKSRGKSALFLASLVGGTLLMSSAAIAQNIHPQNGLVQTQGGYVGPGPAVTTVKQASEMGDDTPVVLRGYIVRSLGDERYSFRDETGTITIEIDHKDWRGLQVSDKDLVEIQGEVDKDFMRREIDVSTIRKVQ